MRRASVALVAVASLLLLGSAQARQLETDPIVGFWNLSGGVVQVTEAGTGFYGTIVKATAFSECVHPVGEVIWRIAKSGTGYFGTHSWFATDAPECKLGGAANQGQSTWTIVDNGSALRLHFCTTSPTDAGDTRCNDLTRAKPVVAWPPLPDALVSIDSVANGCGGGGPASNDPRYGDDSDFVNSQIPFADLGAWRRGRKYHVNFREACKLHDAGYTHAKVQDVLHGGAIVDFFSWTKAQIDRKFLNDMLLICDQQITDPAARIARRNCKRNGGFHLVAGARTRYNLVAVTTYTQYLGIGFYQKPPRLGGAWRPPAGAAMSTWSARQTGRLFIATWTGGPAQPNQRGELRGTIISRYSDSAIDGYYLVTTNGIPGQFTPTRLVWDPKRPNRLTFGNGFTLTR